MLEKSAKKLCKCGCGRPAIDKPGYEYVWGHKPAKTLIKGIACPICGEEYVFLQLHIERTHQLDPKEVQKTYNLPYLTAPALVDSRKGESNGFFGKRHTNETKEKITMTRDGKKCRFGEKPRCLVCGKKLVSDKAKYCRKHCLTVEKIAQITETCRKASLRKWQDPDFILNQIKGRQEQPNKCETFLCGLLNSLFPNEYAFVGDWQVVLGGKCPDFININGQKKLIELFGDYWHRNDNPEDRIQFFAKYGFSTLVIWEKELKDPETLKQNLIKFHKQKRFNEYNQSISTDNKKVEMVVYSGLQGDLKKLAEMSNSILVENLI